ncbi:MAG TPA: GYF domain-containing protein [Candidatus Udaeobacter sp.]|jgi:hypothetical protein|nr:GYF domain-containing protein [Candidatus Udaeobacter sp.]
MKPTKLHVRVNQRELGLFTESKVQRMIRDGELTADCSIRREGSEEWQPASSAIVRIATQEQKDGMRRLGMSIVRGLTLDQADAAIQAAINNDAGKAQIWSRWKTLSAKKSEILRIASLTGSQQSPFLVEWFLSELQETDPDKFEKFDPQELLKLFLRSHATGSWRDDPATEPQLSLLASKGIRIQPGITKGEAHDLIEAAINVVTDGQLRRLHFYGIDSNGLTKDQASDLIDQYVAEHPEAEYQYQLWKAKEIRLHPPTGMTGHEWEEALEWANHQSIDVKFTLPDPIPGEEEASQKQVQYIRSIVRQIDERTLQSLTKGQACSLIDQINVRKKAFAQSKAEEYLRLHPHHSKPTPLTVVFIVLGVVAVIGAIVATTHQANISQTIVPQTSVNQPQPTARLNDFVEERQPLYGQITKTTFAEMLSGGSRHLRPGDFVLVTARNSKFARIDLNGKQGTVPLSSIHLQVR